MHIFVHRGQMTTLYVVLKGLSSLPALFCVWDRAFHWLGTHWIGYTGWLVSYRDLSLLPLGKVITMLSISQMGYGDWTHVLVLILPLGDLWSTLRTHTHIYLTNILTVCVYVCGTHVCKRRWTYAQHGYVKRKKLQIYTGCSLPYSLWSFSLNLEFASFWQGW